MGDKLLGRRINAARKDRGITSERLSELCNINDTYMRQIESGANMAAEFYKPEGGEVHAEVNGCAH